MIRRNIELLRRLLRCLEKHDVPQIADVIRDKLHQLTALLQAPVQNVQGSLDILHMNAAIEITEHSRVHRSQDFQRALIGELSVPIIEGVALVQNGQSVSHGAVRRGRNKMKCLLLDLNILLLADRLQPCRDGRNRHSSEIIALTAGKNRHRELVRLRCAENKNRIGRRFLQCFQKCIEGRCREHVHLIDDEDTVFSLCRGIRYLLNDAADVVDTVVARRIHLHHIKICILCNRPTGAAFAARISVNRMLAVHRLGVNLGDRCFTRSACAAEQVAVADPAGIDLVFQGSDDRITTADILKCLRPVFTIQRQIVCIGHSSFL